MLGFPSFRDLDVEGWDKKLKNLDVLNNFLWISCSQDLYVESGYGCSWTVHVFQYEDQM